MSLQRTWAEGWKTDPVASLKSCSEPPGEGSRMPSNCESPASGFG